MIGYHCAHLVKLVSTKHHATEQQIICLSSVSSVKLDVPFSWPSVVVLQVGSTVQTMIGYLCGTSCEASDFETSCNKAANHMFFKRFKRQAWCTFSWPSVVVLQVGSTVQTMIGYHCAHLVKPVSTKHHATKQQIICLSSVSSVKLDVPFSWPSVVVLQVGSTVQTMIGYHCAHLVKLVSTKHHATEQQIICLSSVSSVKLDVPFSWPSVVVLQVGSTVQTMIGYLCGTSCEASDFETSCNKAANHMFFKRFKRQAWCTFSWPSVVVLQVGSTVQTMIGYHCAHLVKPVSTKHHATKQQIICLSSVSSVKLDVPFLDQVWWFFKLVAQCKPWLATTVAHLVKPATLKHHATKQQIICFSSVSSVKLDVPFSWLSVVVLQVGSTVQTMIGYHCGTSCEASDFETSCNKATNHMFIKRFKRQAWCTFFLTKCGGSSSW